jgi:MFS family permease
MLRRFDWLGDFVGPLTVGTLLLVAQAFSPNLGGRLGWLGDVISWRWTPPLVFAVLTAIAILVRIRRPKLVAPYEWIKDDEARQTTVYSDGLLWVFDGWMRFSEHNDVPSIHPECPIHQIVLAHKTVGRGDKLEPITKAGRFSSTRQFYCVGHSAGEGHAIRPPESADMNSAQLRAIARFLAKKRLQDPDSSRGQS